MAIEDEKTVDISTERTDATIEHRPERAERIDDRHPRDKSAGREPGRDMRSIVKAAIKEHDPEKKDSTERREPDGKLAAASDKSKDGGLTASPEAKTIPEASKSSETAQEAATQVVPAVAAPATAPKEVAAIWDKLPQEAQAVFAKREADMLKGVEQLKSKYKPLDDAFAPVRDQLNRLGKTDAEAASQLIAWQAALANPRTQAQAFRELARAHNFDLSTLAQASPQGDAQDQQTDPSQILRPHLDPLNNRLQSLETEFQRRDRERVQSDIASFSQGKPHFERVKVAMGHLINSGLVSGSNPKEQFDDAYQRACRADPEVFAEIQQEEQAKREADAKSAQEAAAKKAADADAERRRKEAEEVAKARKAGVGPRAGSPVSSGLAGQPRGQSVRDTLSGVLKESRAVI